METETLNQEFVAFFKALADENRLKIIGLLATRPHTVNELAEKLAINASTTSHHLSRLSEIGLVTARAESYFSVYRLETNTLEDMARRLLTRENLPSLAVEAAEGPAFDQKVLRSFLTPEGRIKSFPAQEKKWLVILRYALQKFETGARYPEKQLNEILAQLHEDTASLRRAFIEYRFMARENGQYWRIDTD